MNLEIMEFVETQILPRYNQFGASHGVRHAQSVIAESMVLADRLGVDRDMCYIVAAYHDLGMEGPRAIHHITSGKILMNDVRLRKWFTPEQIRIMKEAVEDHRASASHQPRSIYGKIVAEADRELEPDTVFIRTILYGLEHYPELDYEGQYDRFSKHMGEKYSEAGYIQLWIPNSPNQQRLNTLRNTIAQPEALRAAFDRLYPKAVELNKSEE